MSTLKTNTIQHLTSGFNNVVAHTDGAGTANAVHARAWVNFDGTGTVAIRAQFNVSSITDNGQGTYTVNLTNAMTDANYSFVASPGDATQTDQQSISLRSTTSCVIRTSNSGGTLIDDANLNVVVFR